MPDHPHALAVVNDFTKTITAIATAGIAAVVALSNGAVDQGNRSWFLALLGLCALLLLATVLLGIMLVGKLTRFVRDPTKAPPGEEADLFKSCNLPYYLVFAASIALLSAGVVRSLAPQPPHVAVERIMATLVAVPYTYACQGTAERQVQLLQWDNNAKQWLANVRMSCPSDPNLKPVTLDITVSPTTGELTRLLAHP